MPTPLSTDVDAAVQNTAAAIKLDTKLRIMLADEIAFGPGKAQLLEAIKASGSISAAGRTMEMSYRRAWLLVDSMNRCFQSPLVVSAKGGKNGGGAQVTPLGEEILSRYREMEAAAKRVMAEHFTGIAAYLCEQPVAVEASSEE